MRLNEAHQNRLISQIQDLKAVTDHKMADLREWNKYLSFLSASIFNSYEKAQDILWVTYVELENEHLKRVERDICLERFISEQKSNLIQIHEIFDELDLPVVSTKKLKEFTVDMSAFFVNVENTNFTGSVPKNVCFTQPISSRILQIIDDSKFIQGLLVTILNSSGHNAIKKIGNIVSLNYRH
jgi:hypothetical protein